MKRLIAGMVAALLVAILAFPLKASAISAQKAILLDSDTERVLYEKNGYDRGLIASTTKIMTALIVCEQCNVLDRFRVPMEAVGIEGSSVYLREGEVWTVQELLYGLMLHSGNDAAVALAIYCAGTVEGFVGLMNDKAHRLGLANTHFENPHGLDSPGHYSTAYDMATLTSYAMENPVFAKTVATKAVTAGGRSMRNHNKLLWRLEGADGVKTGFTKASGRILVSSAIRQGRRLVAVTMNAPNDWQDHIALIENGFSAYTVQTIIEKGTVVGYADVAGGDSGCVSLVAAEAFEYPLAKNETVQIVLQKPGFVYAPAVQGEEAGYAYVCIDDKTVGKIPLYYGETVEQIKEEKKSFFDKLLGR
ncbi:MAG: D-alanyl-D-alanine carboxypeptidase [Oscillospiraceae bacterium]|nr:D-alanyl-D-alanine carboxypeptidase [Oscillospiraceae bacterium]